MSGSFHTIDYSSRPALLLLLSCGTGLFVWSLSDPLYGSITLGAIALLLLVFGSISRYRRYQLSEIGLYLLLAACFALFCQSRFSTALQTPQGTTLYDIELTVHHPIASSSSTPTRYSVEISYQGRPLNVLLSTPEEIRIPSKYSYGGRFHGTIDIRSLVEEGELPRHSYRQYLLSEGYHATGTLQTIDTIPIDIRPTLPDRIRHLRANIINSFGAQANSTLLNEEQKGLLYALTLGERAYLSKDVKERFADTGLSHLLAVSGYHLGVIYFLLSAFFTSILYRYRYRKLRYILIWMGLLLFSLLCGASTATMRALVMSTIVLMGKFLDRPSDPIQTLSLTVVVLLIAQPLSLLNPGLVLSISAVWGIIVFVPLFRAWIEISSRLLSYIGNLIFVCVSAQLGVFPFLLYYFQQVVFTIIWSNVPAVLLSSILIPFGLITLIFSTFVPIPTFIIRLLGLLTNTIMDTIGLFSQISEGLTLKVHSDIIQILLYYGILHCLYLLMANRTQIKRISAK